MNIFEACINRQNTFHAEFEILIHLSRWSALWIDITHMSPWTVLEAAAVGVGVTMSGAGGDVVNPGNTSYPTTDHVSGNIDVREGTESGRLWWTDRLLWCNFKFIFHSSLELTLLSKGNQKTWNFVPRGWGRGGMAEFLNWIVGRKWVYSMVQLRPCFLLQVFRAAELWWDDRSESRYSAYIRRLWLLKHFPSDTKVLHCCQHIFNNKVLQRMKN